MEIKSNNCGVYRIINLNNNHMYIGSSKNVKNRMKSHESAISKNKHENKNLLYDLLQGDNFKVEIIEYCFVQNRLEREQYWVDYYGGINSNILYNDYDPTYKNRSDVYKSKLKNTFESEEFKTRLSKLNIGSNNKMHGKHHTEKSKKIISLKQKENILKNGHPKGMTGKIPWNKGIPRPQSVKDAISKANKGKKSFLGKCHTMQTKEKLRMSHLGKANPTKGKIYINNGINSKRVFSNELEEYLSLGWKIGMVKRSGN